LEHVGIPWLREGAIFLVAAGIVVPVFHTLRLSPVLGFLLVGVAIGPFGVAQLVGPDSLLRYAVIGDLEGARALSELGVVFLMFTIGVELSLSRLWSMRRLVLGLGSAQIIVTAAAISVALAFTGTPTVAAMVLGGALALSSTAIVMQLLAERRQLGTTVGRASFGVLLMQDLAAVPILVLVGLAGASDGASAWAALGMAMLKAAVAVAAIVVVGRLLLGPALRWVSATRSRDLFMAITLLAILATAWITAGAGLSMALGAFLAGLLVSESEFRHQIEADIEPFKGLLLGLFFLSVGMGLDPQRLWAAPDSILGAVVALGLLKAVVIAALALAFGLSARSAIECGLLLGQAGEFSFVVITLAAGLGGIAPELAQNAGLVVGLSMLVTPPVTTLTHMIARKLPQRRHADGAEHADLGELEGHVIIAGYGRAGRRIALLLHQEQVPFVALDVDAAKVAKARTEGVAIFVGDAGRAEILARLNAASAQALVVTTDDPDAAERAVIGIRLDYPDLPVFARARDEAHAARLSGYGATGVVQETVESSLQLAARVLAATGVPVDTVDDILAQHRDRIISQ
jgi:monovalent cation:proton antiporter-2 (CPA2) family protein